MASFREIFSAAFRDFRTAGVISSGAHEPIKSEIRAIGPQIDTALSAVGAGILRFATVTAMNAAPGTVSGQLAYVFANNGSTSDPANLVYQWSGSAWVEAPWYFDAVSGVVQPLIDDALENFSIETLLKNWARAEAYTVTSTISRNALGRPISPLNIQWPDGGTGVLTITYALDGSITSFSATYLNGEVTLTVTQPAITYSMGQAITIPALTVA